jgi:four helix bundle protein
MPRARAQKSDRESFDFRHFEVYVKARYLFRGTYQLALAIPKEDAFLRYQLLRAALSIKTNIAEGSSDYLPMEKARFYRIARRSAYETAGLLEEVEHLLRLNDTVCDPLYQQLRQISASLYKLGRRMDSISVTRSARARAKPKA